MDFKKIETHKFQESLKIVLLGILIFTVFVVLRNIAIAFDLFERTTHPNSGQIREGNWKQLVNVFISAVLVAPLIEELAFRLCLSTKRTYLLPGVAFLLAYVLIILDFNRLLPIEHFGVPIFFFMVGASIYMVLRLATPKFELRRDKLWIVILFSSIIFALIHLNVNTAQPNILAYFLLLAPYFVLPPLLVLSPITFSACGICTTCLT